MQRPDHISEEFWAKLLEIWAKAKQQPQPQQPTQG
jgi:hypothetical protein